MLGHSSPGYQCMDMSSCTFIGQAILTREVLGEEEEHAMWDTRETIRTDVEKIVKTLVDASLASEYEFISKLLEHPGIVDTVQTLSDDRRDISELAGDEEEEGTRGDDIRKLRGLIQEQRQEYQEQKTKKKKSVKKRNRDRVRERGREKKKKVEK